MSPAVPPGVLESGRRLRRFGRQCVRIDTRTLAVFRVFAALLIVADLFLRARNFSYFYTDRGVVPRSLVLETASTYPFSIYHLTTDPTLIAALFVLQGLIAIQLLVGYKTRLATILSFLFVVSLDHHNPFVLSYADTLFRLLLFWAIFLPLGERWSIDAVHADREPRPSVANAASALILCQMIFMYFTNGLIKSQSDVWTGGDAAPLVLGLDEMTFLLGDFVRQFSTLLEYGGLLWFVMLVTSPLLLLLRGRPRMLLAATFVAGHLSFALTVRIGAFSYVGIAGVTLFLQSQFWDDANAAARRVGVGIDGSRVATRTASLERLAARVPDYRLEGERILRLRRHAYTATLGIIVLTVLFVTSMLLFNLAPAATGADGEESFEDRIDGTIDETMTETTGVRQVQTVASSLGIEQPIGWGVFAGPDPRTTDRYYVFPAETESGERVDAYSERELTAERPHDELQKQYGTYRERFYMNSVRRGGFQNDVPVVLASHLCETWADEHGEELAYLNMYVIGEEITHETIHEPETRDREYTMIYSHGCGDNGTKAIELPADGRED
ncbi:HTTM domain-containing protein [Natronorubrum sp. JWXQ-INN-674]|uniref:HTTM domain-containing protein n=1 Tax=Natronorubrum halalkaliphilum TaxID=2691917 RepID=A0A6B0VI55_9EURY|nr:HTTM domain-containing protein [Natronorubrum halalkaliphilum]MXV61541.1 HTTM domain-containing protein [Natronorubrum halalkaliphilum]